MTTSEAISILESIAAKSDHMLISDDARSEAMDMAIYALEYISKTGGVKEFELSVGMLEDGHVRVTTTVNGEEKTVDCIIATQADRDAIAGFILENFNIADNAEEKLNEQ